MPQPEIKNWLSIAKEATLLAGEFLRKADSSSRRINQDLIHDVKIEADLQSERMIIDYLRKKSDFSILSEESGLLSFPNALKTFGGDSLQTSSRDEFFWIVDPVDGSLNYVRQLPISCVSIGLWQGEKPILGSVYDFNRDELFLGVVNEGAWLNDAFLTVSKIEGKQKAILASGFPAAADLSSESINAFVDHIQSYRKVRFLGSAAISIAYVACGRVDGYYERDIMWWDIAGAVPVVLGAGGKIQIEKTAKAHCFNVYITNGRI